MKRDSRSIRTGIVTIREIDIVEGGLHQSVERFLILFGNSELIRNVCISSEEIAGKFS